MAERRPREEAELVAYLRAKRAYEKKLGDIAWTYEELFPLMDAYRAGNLKLDFEKPIFELEIGDVSPKDQS
jgi:hypothetical protein